MIHINGRIIDMKAICFICDKKYVMPTSVAIESIKYNTMENYHIYVLGIDLSDLETELLFLFKTKTENMSHLAQEQLMKDRFRNT